jgi:hypothetical protein
VSIDQRIENMEKLRDLVELNGNVYTINMERLRDAYGAGRLGVHVRDGIRNALARLGLGHYPMELPEYQEKSVRLYRKGTPVGDLIEAVLEVDPKYDDRLRHATEGNEINILRAIRELVCP